MMTKEMKQNLSVCIFTPGIPLTSESGHKTDDYQ